MGKARAEGLKVRSLFPQCGPIPSAEFWNIDD